ncbi:MAG: amylo-alpha-1,6-glucosidase [Bacteroidales bacterium]
MQKLFLDKIQLTNLEYSLGKEVLCVGENGCYMSTTSACCNTRKYHGLYVCPQPNLGQDNFVFLSQIEETISQQGRDFHLGVQKYVGEVYEPKGHKYLEKMELDPHPCWTYRVGGVLFRKEIIIHPTQNRLFIKYTLLDAHSSTLLKVKPFTSFRNAHQLTIQNDAACTHVQILKDGIKTQMYSAFSDLYIQCSAPCEFIAQADWYHHIEYLREKERGYDAWEDLFTPGEFLLSLTVNQPVYFSVGLSLLKENFSYDLLFEEAKSNLLPAVNMENCLQNAARNFIVKKGKRVQLIAGYPWFGSWGRDTFIALPGLTLATGHETECLEILRSMIADQRGALFPNLGYGEYSAYNSVDAPLWFIWAVQQYAYHTGRIQKVWREFGSSIKEVIQGYKSGSLFGIHMQENGLIYAGEDGKALTWMDAMVHGKPVTQRMGMPVEINALWYNAIMFAIEASRLNKEKEFEAEWDALMKNFPEVFKACFWDKSKGYLADVVKDSYKDWSLRPNQIIAASLPYSPISEKIKQLVVEKVKHVLLTSKGLRTLTPLDVNYEGTYAGDQSSRDTCYHQGTVWVWLLGHFAEAYLRVYGKEGKTYVRKLYMGFESALSELCMGSVAEIYDGDPPHKAKGAVSQAWSVSELLRIKYLLDQ